MPDLLTATAGVIAGSLLTIFGGWLSDHRQSGRERERERER